MRRAPVVIVALSCKQVYLDRYAEPDKGWTDRDESRWPVPYWDIDTGMADAADAADRHRRGTRRLLLRGAARDYWATFRSEFGVPTEYTPIGAITVGHRAPDRKSPSLKRGRKPVTVVVHRNHWHRRSRAGIWLLTVSYWPPIADGGRDHPRGPGSMEASTWAARA